MKRLLLILVFLATSVAAVAQIENDSLSTEKLNELIINRMELLSEDSDSETDYTELIDNYVFLSENPININSDDISYLLDLQLITIFQQEQLKAYRRNFGDILFAGELPMIEGFDDETIAIITPIVQFGTPAQNYRIKPADLIRRSSNKLVIRTEQVGEPRSGYADIDDADWFDSPNSHYVGSQQRVFVRYSYNYRNKIRAGFTLEKDAGEAFLMSRLPDTLKPLVSSRYRSGFDFSSIHLYATDLGFVKEFVVGDYQLSIGQGLTMSSGMSFGKSASTSSLMKVDKTIKPSTGASEAYHLRGTAVTLGLKGLRSTFFYSKRAIDATVSSVDEDGNPTTISSIRSTGLHRTINEINGYHVIDKSLIGTHIAYNGGRFKLGYTLHHTKLDAELQPTPNNYNQFTFRGSEITNQGMDASYFLGKIVLFGEAAMSDNGGKAILCGTMLQPTSYINLSLLYRNYSAKYQNLYCTAFAENSGNSNEKGIYIGLNASLAPNWQLTSYADFFKSPWLRSSTYAPSFGHDYYLQVNHNISRNASFYIRLRSKDKLTNSSNDNVYQAYLIHYVKNSVRFQIDYSISSEITLKNRAEYVNYRTDEGTNSNGFVMYQDVNYRPADKHFNFSFRYCIFNVDDYQSRIYTYENDVLYSFTVPGFSNKGTRMYLLANYDLNDDLSIAGRIGTTIYSNIDEISSGLELIEGNHRTDLKLQLIWSF